MNARDFALIRLDKKILPGWQANLLGDRKPAAPADPRDWALADQIDAGVVKNLLLLQHHVEYYSGKSAAKIDPLVQKILSISLYQLKFLDRIPPSAAIDEAVEQTKRFGHHRAAGFVNAVLRNVQRQPPPTIPDPALKPEDFARFVLSHPPDLFRRLVALLGAERALAFCRHNNAEPPTIVRLFKGADAQALTHEGIDILPHQRPGQFVVRGAGRTILAEWARQGLAQVQDPTTASVVDLMRISPGQRVLDRCCGLGTKTLQMHEQVGITGIVFAVDPSFPRCQVLRDTLKHRRITNVKVLQVAKLSAIPRDIPGSFDRILVDVPCSNSGVLARRPEARYASGLDSLIKIQRDILDDTAPALCTGGLLIYSTCSIWPEENELQIRQFLKRNPALTLLDERLILPSFETPDSQSYHDGGYIAVLQLPPA